MRIYQILSDFREMDHVLLSPPESRPRPTPQMPDTRPSPPEEDSVCVRFPFQRKLIAPRGLTRSLCGHMYYKCSHSLPPDC